MDFLFKLYRLMGKNSNKVVIVGAGWLGGALATKLQTLGWDVVKTSRQKRPGSDWVQLSLEENVCELATQSAIWFFCIPPGRTRSAQQRYKNYLMKSLVLAEQQAAKCFIFCSSTAVYGHNAEVFSEHDVIQVDSEKQRRLLASERLVRDSNLSTCVVRLGGLFGNQRHPGRFLSGKTLQSSAKATVNMVHQDDAVNGLIFLADKNHVDGVFNLVLPHHPTKEAFYTIAAQQLQLQAPTFMENDPEERIILSEQLTHLGFEFKYTNLFDALTQTKQ